GLRSLFLERLWPPCSVPRLASGASSLRRRTATSWLGVRLRRLDAALPALLAVSPASCQSGRRRATFGAHDAAELDGQLGDDELVEADVLILCFGAQGRVEGPRQAHVEVAAGGLQWLYRALRRRVRQAVQQLADLLVLRGLGESRPVRPGRE